MKLASLIKQYLQEAKLMQLATSVDGQPWVCSVWFASDEEMNVYWFSSITRRHSEELRKNNKVGAAIVLPQTPDDIPRGLQLQGVAEMLHEKVDVEKAISVYAGRIFSREKIAELIEDEETPHRFYRIRPSQFVLFDMVNFPENSRRVLDV